MKRVQTLRAWEDNYIYLFQYEQNRALVIDPADDAIVRQALETSKLTLTHVLITHHHRDHIAGVSALKDQTGCEIVGPDQERIPHINLLVRHGDRLALGSTRMEVIATPGHTSSSVCYYAPPGQDDPQGRLWTGDTLFRGGCGRLFECSAQEMWQSLQKICALPEATLIYGGHDYTEENYRFGLTIEPKNLEIRRSIENITQPSLPGDETMPSTLGQEKLTNVFLRTGDPEIRSALGRQDSEAEEVFAELRARKDRF